MVEDCKDCVYIKEMGRRVEALEKNDREYEKRITELERRSDSNQERVDMIFKILNEIKMSIEKISNKIDEIESRPNKLLWGVLGTIAGAIIMFAFNAMIGV